MKTLLLPFLLLVVAHTCLGQAKSAVDSLKAADATLGNPFSPDLVTSRAYNRLLYRNIVAIGGFNIKQGSAAGTSITVDDKGGTLNVGWVPFLKTDKPPRVALQGIVKATAEKGFVTLFSGEEYQKTLGFGAGVLYFFPTTSGYKERAKKDLQWQYWQQRRKDSIEWKSLYRPLMTPKWRKDNSKILQQYVLRWLDLNKREWSAEYYDGDFLEKKLPWAENPDNQQIMKLYLRAEHAIRGFLPDKWDDDYPTAEDEKDLIVQLVARDGILEAIDFTKARTSADSIRLARVKIDTVRINTFLTTNWQTKASTKLLRTRLKRVDAIQDSTNWENLYFNWVSINGLFNTVQQPLYKADGGATGFADKLRDNYWTGQLNYNWLRLGKKTNWYLTAGASAEKRRQFDPTTLQTYQVVSTLAGNGAVQVVNEKQLYPNYMDQQFAMSGLAGATYYHHGRQEWGISTNFSQKMFSSHQTMIALGIFTPIKAGEANILLMPLVRWDSQGTPHRWTIGVNLTTTLPSFVKPKAKEKS
jgi:hypothetical protein